MRRSGPNTDDSLIVGPAEHCVDRAIAAVLFDYGGVVADEGFQAGVSAIAIAQGYPADAFFEAAREAVYATGYVVGRASEAEFWATVRERYPLSGSDGELTSAILQRFVLRPAMLAAVRRLRRQGIRCALLSDQTDWLDRLERRDGFFREFDRIYNSYRIGKSKRDASLFDDVVAKLDLPAQKVVFIDDTLGHVERARARGLRAIHFVDTDQCLDTLGGLVGLSLRVADPSGRQTT